jgi:hypothetical protein
MKRIVTTVGLGLALLIGMSAAVVLFPSVVGARTTHASRISAPTASHSLLQHRSTSGLRVLQAASRGSNAGFSAAALTAMGSVRHARHTQLDRTGQYRVMAQSSATGTGHKCPGMTSTKTGK